MKIKNKLLSLVVATLAGCCFFGTCVEAKRKNKDSVSVGINKMKELNVSNIDRCCPYDFENGVSVRDYGEYNKWRKYVKKNNFLDEDKLKVLDKKVKKAFETYVKNSYGGSVDSCLISEFDGLVFRLRFNVGFKEWKRAVENAVKKLKGKRPFKEGVGDIKKLLESGHSLDDSLDVASDAEDAADVSDAADVETPECSIYSKEFMEFLAKELGVDFDQLNECMNFSKISGIKF